MTLSEGAPSPSPGSEFLAGLRASAPFMLGSIPFAVIFGVVAANAGLGLWETASLSLFVFSGSAQFIAVSLLAAGASPWVIWMATLFLNLRHTLYAATLVSHVRHLSGFWRFVLSAFLTDETFAVMEARYREKGRGPNAHWAFLGSCAGMYTNWNVWTFLSADIGREMPGLTESGLEFAVIAAFIGMIVPRLKERPSAIAALVAGLIAVFGAWLPYKLSLTMAAIAGVIAAIVVDERRRRAERRVGQQ